MRIHASKFWFVFAQAISFIGLASVTGCSLVTSPEERELRFDPALMRSPPEVAEASIQLLTTPRSEGNARLLVSFKERVAQRGLVIQGGAGPTLLRDDGSGADARAGDGEFSAFVNFDVAGYEAELKRRADLGRKFGEVPVFKNRTLVGKKRMEPMREMRFKDGERFRIERFDGLPFVVDPNRELMITDVSVVEDLARTFNPCLLGTPMESQAGNPQGAWTFGKLMTEMANEDVTGINPSDFTLHWLQQWSTDLVINSFTVGHRLHGLNEQILNPWPRLMDGRLDLEKAPFRLLAIVNRIDLRGSTAYGASDAGEARFVFGLVRCNPPSTEQEAKEFLVIFEYGIKKSSCAAVRDWAQQWHSLGSIVLGSAAYNTALQAITDQFTLRNADPSKLPNRSALNQLRTNELAIALFPFDTFWELREFRICADSGACGLVGRLEASTIAQTPDISFRFHPRLSTFVNDNEIAILAGKHTVPLQLPPPSIPFRGGSFQPGATPWQSGTTTPITNSEARHAFALATCNGCHTGETRTDFAHIAPRAAGVATVLSDFLTGLNQPKTDPVSGVPRTFHELLDRQMKLDAAANMTCFRQAFPIDEIFPRFVPRAFIH